MYCCHITSKMMSLIQEDDQDQTTVDLARVMFDTAVLRSGYDLQVWYTSLRARLCCPSLSQCPHVTSGHCQIVGSYSKHLVNDNITTFLLACQQKHVVLPYITLSN